jgi:hypothetical protein
MADPAYTVSLAPVTDKCGHIVNEQFLQAVAAAARGGDDLEKGFFSKQQTLSEFFDFLALNGDTAYIKGTNPDTGLPTLMVDSGNVEMAGVAAPLPVSAAADVSDDPGRVGTATIRTGFTQDDTVGISQFVVSAAGIAPGAYAGAAFFDAIAKPVASNIKTLYQSMMKARAAKLAGNPELDKAGADADDIGEQAAGDAGKAAEQGAEDVYMAVEWLKGGVGFGALVVLAAIPIILTAVEHTMYSQLAVLNLTEDELQVNLEYTAHGGADITPANPVIPPMEIKHDMFGDKSDTKVAYEANFHLMNSNGFGALGYVVSVNKDTASQGGVVVDIPWAGSNSLWAGPVAAGTDWSSLWKSAPLTETLSQTATVGAYKYTLSTNQLSGKTPEGSFRYDSLLIVEPA